MDKYNTEIFGEFTYAESITYENLLRYETFLLKKLEHTFQDAGAEHLDFSPLGDILMFQCAFEVRNLEILRDIADELGSLLPEGVKGRILCLEKDLSLYHIFWIKRGQWQEQECILPKNGAENIPIHKVVVDENAMEEI